MLVERAIAQSGWDFIGIDEARERWAAFRHANGRTGAAEGRVPLLTAPDGNVKFAKTEAAVYGLALAPSTVSGHNVCPFSTPACRAGCVAFAGKGEFPKVIEGRVLKTRFLVEDPSAFFTLLVHEIGAAWRKHGVKLRVRLNTFSDIRWEDVAPEIFEAFPTVRFYDYTKHPRMHRHAPANYHLTYSVSERVSDATLKLLWHAPGETSNSAVVFNTPRSQPLPLTFMGIPVIDGDKSDDRTRDPRGVIVGLRAKGRMRKSPMGMVREVAS